jgi:hypothetical protein
MSVNSGDSTGIALWFVLSVVVAWLVIYTAVRFAVGHALDRTEPRLVVEAHAVATGVQFAVANVGTGPAFDLLVRWKENPVGEPLARTLMLDVSGRLEWTLDIGPIAGEAAIVRRLELSWAMGLSPDSIRQSTTRAVLVPSRLAPAP